MAGHTSEKRWRRDQNIAFGNAGVSELASELCTQMITALDDSKSAFEELSELFSFVGSTIPGLADQLFKEDYEARSTPGVDAVITVDVVAGVVSNPIVTVGGTNYVDGTGFVLNLFATAGHGGTGNAEMSYDVGSNAVTNPVVTIGGSGYNDGTNIVVTDTPTAPPIFETSANAEEIAKAQDLFDAITALNDLHGAASNQATVTEDRYAQLRRMS